jgi:hypothetical protein
MSLFLEIGSEHSDLSSVELRKGLFHALQALGQRDRVLAIPPDFTRSHSGDGSAPYCPRSVHTLP